MGHPDDAGEPASGAPAAPWRRDVGAFVRDVGGVLGAWSLAFLVEGVSLLLMRSADPDAARGFWDAQVYVGPLALLEVSPFAVLVVGLGWLVARRRATVVGASLGVACGVVAYGISSGRHFANVGLRTAFVFVVAIAAFALARLFVRRLPLDSPRALAAGGAIVGLAAWLADLSFLKGLYPAFHAALFAVALLGAATIFLAVRGTRGGRVLSSVGCALSVGGLIMASKAVDALHGDEQLRRVLFERAPLLGRAVVVTTRLFPPERAPETGLDDAAAVTHSPSDEARVFDWSGRDILLITVDALRADHLGAYGYERSTSPHLDALAARGARFERAYCPIPNTSYSLGSLMTGTYLRPLMAAGRGDGVETWADYLGRAGYQTVAFYPPAVFFVDEHAFDAMRTSGFGFAHHEEGYVEAAQRAVQVESHVRKLPLERPLFLWVHIFEPHEPYVAHPEHPFPGGRAMDAYDSEIAAADALVGRLVALIEARGREPVIVATADHGEAFGERGVHYHSSNVYEEQVRVPLIVVGPKVSPSVVSSPAQIIDVLPTVLSALGLGRPEQVRGRDLAPALAHPSAPDPGFAFAETEGQSLVALGSERLVCVREVDSCTLYDLTTDPDQERPVRDRPSRIAFMRQVTESTERRNRRWEAKGSDPSRELVQEPLVEAELLRRWETAFVPPARGEVEEARRLLAAFVKLRSVNAVPLLVKSLGDVRLRGDIVVALERIGDPSAKEALFAALDEETHFDLRYKEVHALQALGAGEALRAPLERFAAATEPMPDAIQFAILGGLLVPEFGGVAREPAARRVDARLRVRGAGTAQLLVMTGDGPGSLRARVNGSVVEARPDFANLWRAELPLVAPGASVKVHVEHDAKIRAVWIVRQGTDRGR